MSECRCLAWHHPLWAVIGKPAGLKPIAVWGIVCALRDDQILQQLGDKDRVAVLAEGAGLKPIQVALVLAGLEVRGVTVTPDVTLSRSDVTLSRDPSRSDVTLSRSERDAEPEIEAPAAAPEQTKAERNRRFARDRQRRRRARLRIIGSVTDVTLVTPSLKKEEEDDLLLSEEARAPASEAGNWPIEYQRKQGWCMSVIKRATHAGLVNREGIAALYREMETMRPDRSLANWGLSRRANDELDRLDRLLQERARPPVQTEMLMPISGAAVPAEAAARPPPGERYSVQEILAMRQRRLAG